MHGVGTKIARVSAPSFFQYRDTRSHCISRPFPASSSPAVGVLFSATQATTHAPQPVQRSMSITIAHLCFIGSILPHVSQDVLVLPLPLDVDGPHEAPLQFRLDERNTGGLARRRPGDAVRLHREEGE